MNFPSTSTLIERGADQGLFQSSVSSGHGVLGGSSVSLGESPSDIARAAALSYHDADGPDHFLGKRKMDFRKKVRKSKFAKRDSEEEDMDLEELEVDATEREGKPSHDTKFRRSTVQIAKQFISQSNRDY